MKRRRWIKVAWPLNMRELAHRLNVQRFIAESMTGYIIDRSRDTSLEARFIERSDVFEEVIDPTGQSLISTRTEYAQIKFIASSSFPGLELIDSTKGLRSFANSISEMCNNEISFDSLEIDPFCWSEAFCARVDNHFYADSLQISELCLQSSVRAKAVITGDDDVRSAVSVLTGGRTHRIDKIRLSTKTKPKISVLFASNGTAVTYGHGDELFRSAVNEALLEVIDQL